MSSARGPRLSRRQWIASGAGAVVAGVAGTLANAFWIEPGRVDVTRHRIGTGTGSTPVRVTQLSDLHLRAIGHHEERIAHAVGELNPELILITGDIVDRDNNLELVDRFLALLPPVQKIAITGNREHLSGVDMVELARVYAKWNGRLLRNASTDVWFGSNRLMVTGLDDLVAGQPDTMAAFADVGVCRNHLLLAHCPLHRDVYRTQVPPSADGSRVSLPTPQIMLAGHTHGGQIAPLGRPLWRPHGSGRYVRGWYDDGPTAMYVSCGLGTTHIPARIGAVPEIAHFEWVLAST